MSLAIDELLIDEQSVLEDDVVAMASELED
jgi:hypothetical protein